MSNPGCRGHTDPLGLILTLVFNYIPVKSKLNVSSALCSLRKTKLISKSTNFLFWLMCPFAHFRKTKPFQNPQISHSG